MKSSIGSHFTDPPSPTRTTDGKTNQKPGPVVGVGSEADCAPKPKVQEEEEKAGCTDMATLRRRRLPSPPRLRSGETLQLESIQGGERQRKDHELRLS